ncbi:probable E3 ubiquitin-protein ligase HIP1 isoform X2 [Asparagus officinalis]|uniref:probable E3 ubiquitin-protein ligase HIP1 isoform X2 n=1 Tax=Asparagus officinalis TaxID=4686 RepID=UPI00098E837F|nr:probable E3 ubiquitin-protein ligase HIP1 isoform X2 [Asparagus officinalis]
MQSQRSSGEPFAEILDFDHRSGSSTAAMDQDIYWNSMVLHPSEAQNLPNYLVSSSDTNMPYVNMSAEEGPSLSIWNSGGTSSGENSLDPRNHDETKMELGWPTSPGSSGPIEADNMLSLEDDDTNLNTTQIDNDQQFSFSLGSNLNDVSQDLEHNVGDQVSGSVLFSHPYVPSSIECEHGPYSSTSNGTSSGVLGFMAGDYDDRPGSSLDGRRLACKRKNIEGLSGQSSTSGSSNLFHASHSNSVHPVSVRTNASAGINISSPSSCLPGTSSSGEQMNPRFSNISREASPNGYMAANVAGNAERSQRSFRLRMNPALQPDIYPPNLSSSRSTAQNSSIWLPSEPSSNLMPFNQRLEPRTLAAGSSSQNLPHMPAILGSSRPRIPYPLILPPNSRNGNSSTSVNSVETLTAIREDTISRNTPRNDVLMQSLLVPPTETRNFTQDSANWNVANGGASMTGAAAPTSRAGMSSGVHSSAGSTWTPHQNPPTQFSQGLAEAIRRSLLASIGSESRGRNSNFISQRPGQSSFLEAGHQSASVSHGNQQSPMRTALLMDRHSDRIPLSMRSLAAREGRSRMISEDVFMLDHPVFHGVADLHDRHRDMRLDVDNMSYEELLALEERIGNVSTGLGEETIMKCLKQRKHFVIGVGATVETEPCCICQEEYTVGEDLGVLDCGHDFHTACIKQWLTHKNLCPICKTTGLVT